MTVRCSSSSPTPPKSAGSRITAADDEHALSAMIGRVGEQRGHLGEVLAGDAELARLAARADRHDHALRRVDLLVGLDVEPAAGVALHVLDGLARRDVDALLV